MINEYANAIGDIDQSINQSFDRHRLRVLADRELK